MRGSAVPVVQTAAGASLAWIIAHHWLGHEVAIFAPISTFICLGFTRDRVPRKVAELGAGATLGVAVGELFSTVLEVGWWEIFVVLVVATLLGRLIDRGDLFTMQAGVNSLVIVGMSWYDALTGQVGARWVDALVGALVAFVVAVLLPRRVSERPLRYARATLEELAGALEMLAGGMRAGDLEVLRDAQAQLRGVRDVRLDWETTLATASDVVVLNPTLKTERSIVAELERLYALAGRTEATAGMLARQAIGMVSEQGSFPRLGASVAQAARAVRALAGSLGGWHRPILARTIAESAASGTAPDDYADVGWRPVALLSVVRSLFVDILQLTGLSRADARSRLPDAAGNPYADDDGDGVRDEDRASSWWGSDA